MSSVTIVMGEKAAEWLIDQLDGNWSEHAQAIIGQLNTELDAHHEDGWKTVRMGGEFKVFHRSPTDGQLSYRGWVKDTGQTTEQAFREFQKRREPEE